MADTVEPTAKAPRKTAARKTPARKAASGAAPKAVKAAPVKKAVTRKPKAAPAGAIDWKAQADQIKAKAASGARVAADAAKEKTGTAMQSLAKLISDTAGTVDSKLGPQYGDYARYAAEAVAGAAKSLDAKDIEQLTAEARDFVRKSPAVAIGAAAIAGFVLMRLAKGSGSDES